MEETVRLRATLTRRGLFAFFVVHGLLRRPLGYVMAVVLPTIWLIRLGRADARALTSAAGMGLGFLAFFLIATSSLLAINFWRMRDDGLMLEPKDVTIDASGVDCVGAAHRSMTSWSLISRLLTTHSYIAFQLRDPRAAFLLVPRADLPAGSEAIIARLFAASRPPSPT
jgi:hypothetical protein